METNYTLIPFLSSSSPFPFLPHSSFHIPSFPWTLILSYNLLSNYTQPFIYPYFSFLRHSSFPTTLILSDAFLSSNTHPFLYLPFLPYSLSYTFLSSHTQPFIYPFLPFLPHSLSYKCIIFPFSHTHPTFSNLILFLFLSHSSNLS